jgi:GPI transamidase subunit PIG-U
LLLAFFNLFWPWTLKWIAPLIWIGLDYISWRALRVIAAYQAQRKDEWNKFTSSDDADIIEDLAAAHEEVESNKKKDEPVKKLETDPSIPPKSKINPEIVGLYYLLNPYTILTCIGHSTQSISTTLTFASLALATQEKASLSLILISVAAYLSVYPIMFLIPNLLILSKNGSLNRYKAACVVCTTLGWLLYASYIFTGNWVFIDRFYGTLYISTIFYLHKATST